MNRQRCREHYAYRRWPNESQDFDWLTWALTPKSELVEEIFGPSDPFEEIFGPPYDGEDYPF